MTEQAIPGPKPHSTKRGVTAEECSIALTQLINATKPGVLAQYHPEAIRLPSLPRHMSTIPNISITSEVIPVRETLRLPEFNFEHVSGGDYRFDYSGCRLAIPKETSMKEQEKNGPSVRELLVHLFGEPTDSGSAWTFSERGPGFLDPLAANYVLKLPVGVGAFSAGEPVSIVRADVDRLVNQWLSENGRGPVHVFTWPALGWSALESGVNYWQPGSLGEYLRSLPAVGDAVGPQPFGRFTEVSTNKYGWNWTGDQCGISLGFVSSSLSYDATQEEIEIAKAQFDARHREKPAAATKPIPVDPYKKHAAHLAARGVELFDCAEGPHSDVVYIRRDHVEQLKRELDRKLVVMAGAGDCWDGEA